MEESFHLLSLFGNSWSILGVIGYRNIVDLVTRWTTFYGLPGKALFFFLFRYLGCKHVLVTFSQWLQTRERNFQWTSGSALRIGTAAAWLFCETMMRTFNTDLYLISFTVLCISPKLLLLFIAEISRLGAFGVDATNWNIYAKPGELVVRMNAQQNSVAKYVKWCRLERTALGRWQEARTPSWETELEREDHTRLGNANVSLETLSCRDTRVFTVSDSSGQCATHLVDKNTAWLSTEG